MKASTTRVTVVPSESRHTSQVAALAALVYPGVTGWPVDQLMHHRRVFPDGQLVALDHATGQVVGASLNLIIDWTTVMPGSSYMDIIDSGWFHTHDAERGDVLYAADLFVRPTLRGTGVGGALLSARWEMAQRLGKSRIRGSARLTRMPPSSVPLEIYLRLLREGLSHEPSVGFLVSRGARLLDVLMDHFTSDQDGCPHAVLTEWGGPPRSRPCSDHPAESNTPRKE